MNKDCIKLELRVPPQQATYIDELANLTAVEVVGDITAMLTLTPEELIATLGIESSVRKVQKYVIGLTTDYLRVLSELVNELADGVTEYTVTLSKDDGYHITVTRL